MMHSAPKQNPGGHKFEDIILRESSDMTADDTGHRLLSTGNRRGCPIRKMPKLWLKQCVILVG